MNILVVSILVLFGQGIAKDYFLSVTKFPEIEKFYLELNEQVLYHRQVISTSLRRTKSIGESDICSSILKNIYFKDQNILPVDIFDPNVRIEIQTKYPEICRSFNIEGGEADGSCWSVLSFPQYIKRSIHVGLLGHIVSEDVVLCLARVSSSGKIKEYFVSQAYNPHPRAINDKIYFVFVYTDLKELIVEALAEEAATASHNQSMVELNYLTKRWENNKKPTQRSKEDPICSLSISRKLRICASIINSRKYQQVLEFIPIESHVRPNCTKNDVFLYKLSRRGGSSTSEGLSEWMFGCEARKINFGTWVTLYVSRGYDYKNSIFVYKLLNFRFELVEYFKHVHALFLNVASE